MINWTKLVMRNILLWFNSVHETFIHGYNIQLFYYFCIFTILYTISSIQTDLRKSLESSLLLLLLGFFVWMSVTGFEIRFTDQSWRVWNSYSFNPFLVCPFHLSGVYLCLNLKYPCVTTYTRPETNLDPRKWYNSGGLSVTSPLKEREGLSHPLGNLG